MFQSVLYEHTLEATGKSPSNMRRDAPKTSTAASKYAFRSAANCSEEKGGTDIHELRPEIGDDRPPSLSVRFSHLASSCRLSRQIRGVWDLLRGRSRGTALHPCAIPRFPCHVPLEKTRAVIAVDM